MAIFPDDITDTMQRILVRRNSMWAAKIASQDTSSTMFRHHENTRCICEPCSDTRPSPKSRPSMRTRLAHDPQPSTDGNGSVVVPIPRPPLNPPDVWPSLDTDRIPFAIRLATGPNRRPASVSYHEGTRLLKKGHF